MSLASVELNWRRTDVLMLCIPVPLPQSTAVFCKRICTHHCKVHSIPLSLCQYTLYCSAYDPFLTVPILQSSFHMYADSLLGPSCLLKIWFKKREQLDLQKCSHSCFWLDRLSVILLHWELWTLSTSNTKNSC